MLADRGVDVDHVSLHRWVQRFAPELEKRVRRHLRPCRRPWHAAEIFVRTTTMTSPPSPWAWQVTA